MRINKFIAQSGYCSRRDADNYIEQGRVTVNGRDCFDFSTEVATGDIVEVDGERIKIASGRIYIALHKPVGVTSTTDQSDPTNIIDFVNHKERIFPIGRLDKASEGVIFLTNDGDIVNKILRAGNAHDKQYIVTVDRPFDDHFLESMATGVKLDKGERTLPCNIKRESITSFNIILRQGLNRQIRRMCDSLGYRVERLVRVRIMNISLRGLQSGKWRYFTHEEIENIERLTAKSSKVGLEKKKSLSLHSSKPTYGANGAKKASTERDKSPTSKPRSEGRTANTKQDIGVVKSARKTNSKTTSEGKPSKTAIKTSNNGNNGRHKKRNVY